MNGSSDIAHIVAEFQQGIGSRKTKSPSSRKRDAQFCAKCLQTQGSTRYPLLFSPVTYDPKSDRAQFPESTAISSSSSGYLQNKFQDRATELSEKSLTFKSAFARPRELFVSRHDEWAHI